MIAYPKDGSFFLFKYEIANTHTNIYADLIHRLIIIAPGTNLDHYLS
jgi:hypothetical protein